MTVSLTALGLDPRRAACAAAPDREGPVRGACGSSSASRTSPTKRITLALQSANEALLLAAVVDREARGVYPHAQRRPRHCATIPHRLKNIVPCDDSVAVLDEKLKEIKDLRFDGNKVSPAAQFTAVGVEGVIFKRIQQLPPSVGPPAPNVSAHRIPG